MMKRQTITNHYGDVTQFPDRAFLLTSYVNSEDKKNHFIKILKHIRENYENSFIVFSVGFNKDLLYTSFLSFVILPSNL